MSGPVPVGAARSRGGEPPEPVAGPLAGLLVADFSRILAGHYATMMLAYLGAEVIKVEHPPRGDDTRTWGPPHAGDGTATYVQSVNRNEVSVWWDLDDASDLDRARQLTTRADVLVENFAPGTMARFGLDHPTVAGTNRGSCTPPSPGPHRTGCPLAGYDLLVQAMGGLMSVTGPEPGSPTKVGVAAADVLTGLHATIGILAALAERTRTGRGSTCR
jgi:crotonobetainyl-CoA:carnitine CoA-transferase CaiB-like acyl-CoA transferase